MPLVGCLYWNAISSLVGNRSAGYASWKVFNFRRFCDQGSLALSFLAIAHFHFTFPLVSCISVHCQAFPCISVHFRTFPCISVHFRAFPRICAFPRIYAHFRAFPCISMHLCAFPRISAHFREFPCISMHCCAFPSISVQFHAISRI